MKRRQFITLLGGAAAWPVTARAQQRGKVHRIGFAANDPTIPITAAGAAFLEGLRENGFVEGKNIVIERRFAEGRNDRAVALIAELVRSNIDLIMSGVQNHLAAKQASTKILRTNTEREIDTAFASASQMRAAAMLVGISFFYTIRREQLASLAAQVALPTIYGQRELRAAS